ncbi:MAG TPA: DUF2946 family protein [Steroidobacteraceae bacterium]|nr:DUF2946 family protein [Steroidobacteraceae bacterium]
MPASDGSFSLKICHSGFLTQSGPDPAGHAGGHPDGHSHVEFCPFGAVPGAAPISDVPAFLLSSAVISQAIAEFAARAPGTQFERAHPARGPPLLA